MHFCYVAFIVLLLFFSHKGRFFSIFIKLGFIDCIFSFIREVQEVGIFLQEGGER